MAHTKEELLYKTYQLFFDSMMDMNFPLDKINSFVPTDVMGYGTTIDERILGYDEFMNLVKLQRTQVEGEVYWDRQPVFEKLSQDGNTALFVEEMKVTMKMASGDHIIPLRITSVLSYDSGHWQLVHWHGSQALEITDDTWHKDEWKQKNEALQKLVNEKTADLETKNRELEIEASMERVRGVAMGMQEARDLLKICEVLFNELEGLGFDSLRNTMVNLNNDQESLLHNYDYSSKSGGEITEIPFDSHPATKNIVRQLKSADNAFGQFALTGKKLEEWRDYRKKLGEKDDPKLKNTKKLSYYFYSIGTGSIGVSTYEPISKQQLALLERFRNVFELAYQRYIDIQQAIEQAREAKIEAALEKVRARTMAMQHSSELPEAANLLFLEVQSLGIPAWSCGYNILAEDKKSVMCWMSSEGQIQSGFHLPFTNTGEKSFPQWEHAIKNRIPFLVQELGGKEIQAHYDYMRTLPQLGPILEELDEAGLALPTYQINHLSFFNGGFLLFITYEKVPEAHDLFKRFTKVFEQTFTRFLDLQNAEAQAREAQIEAALERVRATSMAMHKTEDIASVVVEFFEQLKFLDVKFVQSWINVMHPDEGIVDVWFSPLKDVYEEPAFFKIPLALFENTTVKAWKAGEPYSYVSFNSKEELNSFFKACDDATGSKYFSHLQKKLKLERLDLIDANYKFGAVSKSGIVKATPEEESILQRFAKVFEQAYTRFLDLQKAEAQVRESQIEAALERIRAASLAMHSSSELKNVINVIFGQFKELNIDLDSCYIDIFQEDSWDFNLWVGTSNDAYPEKLLLPYGRHSLFKRSRQARLNGETFVTLKFNHASKNRLVAYLAKSYKITKQRQEEMLRGDSLAMSIAFNKHASLALYNYRGISYTTEENEILRRVSKVFEQTYTRFLDLEKAEAQAREAQVETALERVRSRTMAMHSSDELAETASVLFQQLRELGLTHERTNIGIVDDDNEKIDFWVTTQTGELVDKPFPARIKDSETTAKIYKGYKTRKKSIVIHQEGAELKKWLSYITEKLGIPYSTAAPNEQRFQSIGYFSRGMLIATSTGPLGDEALSILEKFAAVFEQTYTRFLDLQKAEAQAREAQIEAALERIRSQAMAMNESTDLLDIVVTMRTEFVNLGNDAGYFWYMRWQQERYEKAMTSGDGTRIGMVMELPRSIHGEIPVLAEWEQSDRPTVVYPMDADTAISYVDKMVSLGDFKQVDPNAPTPDDIRHIGGITFIMARTTYGEIGYSLNGVVEEPPQEALALLERFAGVFDLAYRRFEDLQVAEAQAKAATKQASLDRVRAEIASMRTPKDLERITPLVWKELTALGVPFFRCGIFIIKEDEEMVHAYLSTPAGESLAALHIGFDETEIGMIGPSIDNWRKQEVYHEEWDQKRFLENMQLFMKRGDVKSSRKYQDGDKPPEKLVLHLVPFKQGMLYVGNSETLVNEHIDLMQELAKAFSIAYSRYEDFVLLEEAKHKVENTLNDLKEAQSQLIHAEKMASLGELTAGIAHEIQNPLNFVNNFSEVNKELMEELLEELSKGDMAEVKAIAQDIVDNDNKIVHHGKRAEGIVKGMLQHSRSNSGEKEPTDINVLADEYLRLSYHGLRAKDKSFNADFKLDLDATLPKVNVVPQDLGRVLLNLINNAFYACAEHSQSAEASAKESAGKGYKPLVTVTTKALKQEKAVEIMVSDNGPGIPEEIKDKIFQPFFTTKATGEGTGLGLSLSYDIVTKGHEGTLKVDTSKGKGTSFTMILPLKA